jgi:hypothetical protein
VSRMPRVNYGADRPLIRKVRQLLRGGPKARGMPRMHLRPPLAVEGARAPWAVRRVVDVARPALPHRIHLQRDANCPPDQAIRRLRVRISLKAPGTRRATRRAARRG